MMSGSRSLPSTRLKTDVGPWVTGLRLRLPPGQRQRFQGRQDSQWTTAWTRCRVVEAPVVCSLQGTRSSEARATAPSWPANLFRSAKMLEESLPAIPIRPKGRVTQAILF